MSWLTAVSSISVVDPQMPADEVVVMVVRARRVDVDVALGLEPLGETVLDEEVECPEHRRAAEERMLDPEQVVELLGADGLAGAGEGTRHDHPLQGQPVTLGRETVLDGRSALLPASSGRPPEPAFGMAELVERRHHLGELPDSVQAWSIRRDRRRRQRSARRPRTGASSSPGR